MILVSLFIIVILLLLFWAAQAAGKTLWEYLEILIIPAVLGIIALLFNTAARKRDREAEEAARKRESDIESDRQRQAILATYFDVMTDLLLDRGLYKPEKSRKYEAIRTVAKSRTLSALRSLDGERKGRVLRFLYESGLISEQPVIILQSADLRGAHLIEAHLIGANLADANLYKANLYKADLSGAELIHVCLEEANLQEAYLHKADLMWANLEGANLIVATLAEAILQEAFLMRANLMGATLAEAILWGADLTDATVTPEQLSVTRELENATMPNGMKYEEWVAKGKPDWSKGTAK